MPSEQPLKLTAAHHHSSNGGGMYASKLILGTAQIGLKYGINNSSGPIADEEVKAIFRVATHAGITIIDTAPAYGSAETRIGNLAGKSFRIVSKFSYAARPADLNRQLENSLAALKIKQLYGYLAHSAGNLTKHPELWETLQRAKEDSRVEKTGLSVYEPSEIDEVLAMGIRPDIVQLPYSLLDRKFEALMPRLKESGAEIHVRSVFLQGLYFMNPAALPEKLKPLKTCLEELQAYAGKYDIPVSALALHFVLGNPYADYILTGVDSAKQLRKNLEMTALNRNSSEIHKFVSGIEIKNTELLNPANW